MVFLSILFPWYDEAKIREKSVGKRLQNQVNRFQWNVIDGLYENNVEGLHIVNVLPVGTYPFQYKQLFLPTKEWKYNNEMHQEIGCINLPFLKQFIRYKKTKALLKKMQDKEIIIYSTYLPFLKAVQKLDSSYHVKLIVADLPEYYDLSEKTSKLKKFFRKRNNELIYKCLNRVDSFVLLTEQMKYPLKVGNRPYVVVEGISNSVNEFSENCVINEDDIKSILYTGALEKQFGLDVLLEAFSFISDDKCELWICGSGSFEDEIKKAASVDTRIKFYGYVSKEEAEEKQKEASILINPRQNKGEYTKYSFPSKTMEYLASGTPLVAYKLDGIPDEYDKYINYVNGNSAQSLHHTIMGVFNHYEYYVEVAQRAVEFIRAKNPKGQTKKILDLK